mmetsp:Transcript_31347/g.76469  ORF Transcript_31347/g.76469 Transcript_31347/m.76469 type:complete len:294 (+) Transcript_31347:167-1048(+)|eukprot:CAMPEP_0114527718 /NCGR_PEP_ID=MMETSP0109-20121206/23783_1 /TAXON_ID=29199 /ORGANISM="Chlorarachnion reptans, Strain CCCM449" /LENGTH=293 /DNA_ID=CAMNT_0001709737 /DNA_START=229 /DNA_END=1110 /DNA_ORIENTATION=-
MANDEESPPGNDSKLNRKKGTSYGALSANEAYQLKDAVASQLAHQIKKQGTGENHAAGGEFIKSAVFGGLDGIITTFATVTTVAGARLSSKVVLILGIAHLFADGISMGLGDYTSTKAEQELVRKEREREEWECDSNLDLEVEEMVEIFQGKGLSRPDAEIIMKTLAKYRKPFVDLMMIEELGMNPNDDDDAFMGGFITFVSFVVFGAVPLLPYVVALLPGVDMTSDTQLNLSLVLTAVTMFVLGTIKGKYVADEWLHAGFHGVQMTALGCLAAFLGWAIGFALSQMGLKDMA